jgi:hypothetical protein
MTEARFDSMKFMGLDATLRRGNFPTSNEVDSLTAPLGETPFYIVWLDLFPLSLWFF